MKILFLSQIVPYPPHGGVLQRGFHLIRQLSKENTLYLLAFVHPDVLTTPEMIQESQQELQKICRKVEYFKVWPKESKLKKILAIFWGFISLNPFGVIAYKSRKFRKGINQIMKDETIDLVHFDTISLAQYFDRHWKIPCTLTHQNIESCLMTRRSEIEKNPFSKFYLILQTLKIRYYEKKKSPLFNVNVTVSDNDTEELISHVQNIKTFVIPNGVDVQYFQPQRYPQKPVVIYTGGMNMYANRDAVLYFINDILPVIRKDIPDIVFYAIGQDPPKILLELSEKDKQIIVPGFVGDIRPYVANASVYVVPLRVGGGTRLKVLDAMAMGKAIISTSLGCEGIRVTTDENILVADDPVLFAQKTVYLMKNQDLRERIGRKARQLVETHYTWEKIGAELNKLYGEIYKNSLRHE